MNGATTETRTLVIRVTAREDEVADLSTLGFYAVSDSPQPGDWSYRENGLGWRYGCAASIIDRGPFVDRWERYFHAYVPLDVVNPKTGKPYSYRTIRRWAQRQYERMESYQSGDWGYIGIQAEAHVEEEDGHEFTYDCSPGLWGVESDAGRDYLLEIAAEECEELRDRLCSFGFTADEIDAAIKRELDEVRFTV